MRQISLVRQIQWLIRDSCSMNTCISCTNQSFGPTVQTRPVQYQGNRIHAPTQQYTRCVDESSAYFIYQLFSSGCSFHMVSSIHGSCFSLCLHWDSYLSYLLLSTVGLWHSPTAPDQSLLLPPSLKLISGCCRYSCSGIPPIWIIRNVTFVIRHLLD